MTCSCCQPVAQCEICRKTWREWEDEVHSSWCPANPKPRPHDPVAACRCGGVFILRDGKNGEFYGCSRYPGCTHTASVTQIQGYITRMRIATESKTHRHPCGRCGAAQSRRHGMVGWYWLCGRCDHETPIYEDCED